MREFISVAEAQQLILAVVPRQPLQHVALAEALGHTLAEDVVSREAIPPFANSAMDGYAVRTADLTTLPGRLRVVEDIAAGMVPTRALTPGTCTRIMTGAPVPVGADAVAPVEWTRRLDGQAVAFDRAPTPGQHLRPAGEDVQPGDVVAGTGTVVTPPVVGMLATLGQAQVAVRVPPRVAVIATGDELVDAAQTPAPGQIRNANGPALVAQARAAGADVLPPFHARDDRAHIRSVVEAALEADVLVFSGGVSVGDYDYVKAVLDGLGLALAFWKVRQRPGKPLAFGMLRGKPVFGLPGNPVSSFVCFDQYVRPALAQMLGRTHVGPETVPAVLAQAVDKVEELQYFTRAWAAFDEAGCLVVRPEGRQGSNIYSSVLRANCLLHLPAGVAHLEPGAVVRISWLDG